MSKLPGGALASLDFLHFVWIADCSGSMGLDGKIQALNNAIREAIPHMQQVAPKTRTHRCSCAPSLSRMGRAGTWPSPHPSPTSAGRTLRPAASRTWARP